MLILDRGTDKVFLQFLLNSAQQVPTNVLDFKPHKTGKNAQFDRAEYALEPVNNCRAETLPDDLERYGYKLLEGFWQERTGFKTQSKYFVVRFLFSRSDCLQTNEHLRRALQKMLTNTTWLVFGFNYINRQKRVGIFFKYPSTRENHCRDLFVMNSGVYTI